MTLDESDPSRQQRVCR